MTKQRPRIGITMRIEQTTNRFYLGRDYGEAVEAAGGLPITEIGAVTGRGSAAGAAGASASCAALGV